MPPRKQLGQILLEAGLIDEFQLKSALGYQKKWGGRLGKVLVENHFITEQALVQAVHEQTGTPIIDVSGIEVPDYLIRLVPMELASRHMLLPVRLDNESGKSSEVLLLAMADPTNLEALDEIRFRTGKRTRPLLAAESDIEKAIRRVYLKEEVPPAVETATVDVPLEEDMMVVQGRLETPPPTSAQEKTIEEGVADPFAELESLGGTPVAAATPTPLAPQNATAAMPTAAGDLPEIELVDEVATLAAATTTPTLTNQPRTEPAAPPSIQEILNRVGVKLPQPDAAPSTPPATSPLPTVQEKEFVRELDERIEQLLGRLEAAVKDEELPPLMKPSHVVAALVRLLLRKELISVEELLEELKQQ